MEFGTREEAMLWMLANQFARRNLNQSQRAYLIGKRYLAETPGQGARTDFGSGSAGVAERLGAEFRCTDRTIREFGRFAEAVDTLVDTIGVDARAAILNMEVPFSREDIRTIAACRYEHREVWEAALKDRSSLKGVLAALKRRETKAETAKGHAHPGVARTTAMDRYDIADLVRLISTTWDVERIATYEPTYTQQVALETHLEGALRSNIRMVELNGWGKAALEDYARAQGEDA